MLRVRAGAPPVDDHIACDCAGEHRAAMCGDGGERKIKPGGNARAGGDGAIDYEHSIFLHTGARVLRAQLFGEIVMSSALPIIEQIGLRRDERAGARSKQARMAC
jgi:hypothetical protein